MGGCVGVMRWLRGWFYYSYMEEWGYAKVISGYFVVLYNSRIDNLVLTYTNMCFWCWAKMAESSECGVAVHWDIVHIGQSMGYGVTELTISFPRLLYF